MLGRGGIFLEKAAKHYLSEKVTLEWSYGLCGMLRICLSPGKVIQVELDGQARRIVQVT